MLGNAQCRSFTNSKFYTTISDVSHIFREIVPLNFNLIKLNNAKTTIGLICSNNQLKYKMNKTILITGSNKWHRKRN